LIHFFKNVQISENISENANDFPVRGAFQIVALRIPHSDRREESQKRQFEIHHNLIPFSPHPLHPLSKLERGTGGEEKFAKFLFNVSISESKSIDDCISAKKSFFCFRLPANQPMAPIPVAAY